MAPGALPNCSIYHRGGHARHFHNHVCLRLDLAVGLAHRADLASVVVFWAEPSKRKRRHGRKRVSSAGVGDGFCGVGVNLDEAEAGFLGNVGFVSKETRGGWISMPFVEPMPDRKIGTSNKRAGFWLPLHPCAPVCR